ncbi:hypothetical protein EKD16_00565 [Streptomonospora litoralis]|uniref:Uncharacterized protein n=2 Tax=Streptomonospora litoralis TaxID=2498135 RepID=A0A4P6PZV6_9ACTN|nr:hypothetical protein EKD16_00565 [Streptomonospora litoralis]
MLVAAAVFAVATLALWATGGLARADPTPEQEPGTEVRTKMYTLTPHKAEFTTGSDGLTALRISADLVSNHTKPFQVSELNRTIEIDFPSGRIDPAQLSLTYARQPDGFVFEVQPAMREEVLMTWTLRKAEAEDKRNQQEEDSDNPLAGLGGEPAGDGGFDLGALTEQPEDVAPLAKKEEKVVVSFNENEYVSGFTDQRKRWQPTERAAAQISFPLGEG